MLSIGKLVSARYYLDSVAKGIEDYYAGHGEAPGVWVGAAAAALGLSGQVEGDDLRAVLAGQEPGGEMLVSGKAAAAGRLPGFDLTMSAPKSVTLLFALGDEAVREATRGAHDAAVVQALGYLEAEAARIRRGHDGLQVQMAGGLVAAAFRHRTSRAGDPQLHTHVLVANLAPESRASGGPVDGDGPAERWSALDGRAVYAHARTAGFLYQAALRSELTRRLGVRWSPVRRGVAEVAGFTRAELTPFSQRRTEITAALAERGAGSARAAQAAALDTRQAKHRDQRIDAAPLQAVNARDYGVEAPALVEVWRERGDAMGLTAEVVTGRTGPGRRPLALDEIAAAGVLLGPAGLTAQASSFDRRDVLRALAERAGDGASVEDLRAAASRFLARPGLVRLDDPGWGVPAGTAPALRTGPVGAGVTPGHLARPDVIRRADGAVVAVPTGGRWTTAGLLAVEADLLDRARAGRNAGVAVAGAAALDAALADRPTLGDEQAEMVRRLTTSGAGIDVVIGAAGTGKTFALDAARAAWAASGITVAGATLSARAADELTGGSGIRTGTLAQLLIDLDRAGPSLVVPRGSVLVVDEAGIVGTRTLARLAQIVSGQSAKLVLVGDPRQLPEIDAGGGLAALAARVGAVHLVDNRRQAEVWERQALTALRDGRAAEAVAAYGAHGRVHLAPTADAAMVAMVADWADARRAGTAPVMLARRRATVAQLNGLARAVRVEGGELSGPEVVAAGGARFAVGDEVVGLRTDRRVGFLNGTRAQVTAVDPETRTVTVTWPDTRGGEPVSRALPAAYVDAHLGHGYAMTGYKAQGMTADRVLALGDDGMTAESGYVAMSRGRAANDLYWVAPAPPAGARRGLDADALDELARTLRTRGAKAMATESLRAGRPGSDLAGRTIGDLEAERNRLGTALRLEQPPAPGSDLDGHRRWLAEAETELESAAERREQAAAALAALSRWQRSDRAALAQRVEAETAAVTGWSAQVDLRQARLAPIEAADVAWTGWATARATQIERYARLGEAVDRRREALVTAAEVDSPRWLTATLGAEPDGWYERLTWRHAVADVVTWRDRHGVTDPERMFGDERVEPGLANVVENAARRLQRPLTPELGQRLGLDFGPDL
jgi:conjugative relaxase-like TrwC/TraI family protein